MQRRTFLQAAGLLGGFSAFGFNAPIRSAIAAACGPLAVTGPSPYGPLLAADANGLQLPAGFTSRVLARSGQLVGTTGYTWRNFPDGGACFPNSTTGGWYYASNNEVSSPGGGAQALEFSSTGAIVRAYSILSGSQRNCAGGKHQGKWLSCEEVSRGVVWECDPKGVGAPIRRLPLGSFAHEAALSLNPRIYLTEDQPDGRFYRFTPSTWPSLAAGVLEVMVVTGNTVTWLPIPNPNPTSTQTSVRRQVPSSTIFNGGEGITTFGGKVFFTTKGDQKVWEYDPINQQICTRYDNPTDPSHTITGPDNITAAKSGDMYVCEDPGNVTSMELVLIEPDGTVSPFVQITGQTGSEFAGVAFTAAGNRMYFSSQRGGGLGITYEVSGPFRTVAN